VDRERFANSLLIAHLARGTRRQIEQVIAPTGLWPTELLALQHLRERGPSARQALAALIGIDATNLVSVLNSLEDGGLIERRRDPADRRRAIIALSLRASSFSPTWTGRCSTWTTRSSRRSPPPSGKPSTPCWPRPSSTSAPSARAPSVGQRC